MIRMKVAIRAKKNLIGDGHTPSRPTNFFYCC